ncbi:MAG: M16 family metallopeptidase [Geitlerinemataceae cyanobacterium]
MSDPFRTSTADPQLSSRLPANIYQRADGLTLIHQEIEAVPVVVTDIWVDAGARHEYPEDSGLAHFLEHMIFKGTDRLSPGAFDCAIEGRGGATNAATSHDYAHFYITTADRDFEATLPDLCDLLLRAKIPDDEFELEREVVYEEIAQYRDNPDDCLFAATMASLYPASAYGRPVLGTRDRLESLTPETMRQFHRQYYQPHNMTVTIVGNVSFDRARDALERHCTDFRPPASYRDDRPVSAPPRQTQICRDILELPNLELARLNLAWHGPGVENLRDGYVLDAIAMILSGGRSSPLVRELREQRQWVQAIGSYFSLQQDSGLFSISAWLDATYLQNVEEAIVARLAELHDTAIAPAVLERAKRQLCNDFVFSTETPSQLAGLYGYYHTLDRADRAFDYPREIATISPEEITTVARRYLATDAYTATIAICEPAT